MFPAKGGALSSQTNGGATKKVGKNYQHETVKHIQLEYKRKGDPRNIHTNSVEGFLVAIQARS